MRIIILFLFLTLNQINGQNTTVIYQASTQDIPNPDRGFYLPTETHASNYTPLDSNYIASRRTSFTPYNANYAVLTTLVFRYFILDDFVDAPISIAFLNNLQADFDIARSAGVKLIIRFSYTNTPPTGSCGNWICPPYGDATKARILEHITQLTPYLTANKDIISSVQMGFIGVWGENYYTDHFGDASLPPYILTNTNWDDRSEVLSALLAAVPSDRMIQVRYPQIKQKYIYGNAASTNSPSLMLSEAYLETDKARIGFHNDCFLASDTDFGTYNDYGPPSSGPDTTNLKPYFEGDSKYVPVGGETCSSNNPDDDCTSLGGRADSELNRFNYTYLNCEYNNPDVNNDWTGICMDDIKLKLGYRFSLIDGSYPDIIEKGNQVPFSINLINEGYRSPHNKRGVELILRNTSNGTTFFAPLSADPRLWFPGSHSISESICIPPNIPTGTYDLFLNFPDPDSTLFDNPLYSIQLANENLWESSTGFNSLNHSIQIINSSNISNACIGNPMFINKSVYDPSYCPSLLNLMNDVMTDVYQASDEVISNGNIPANNFVIFLAENEIELNPGFEVNNGATFWAIIQSCYE